MLFRSQLALFVTVRRKLKRCAALYRAGESFDALYAVRSGFFKSRFTYEDGRDRVTGFSIAGEILGMDGIGPGCRPLGKVSNAQPLINHDGQIRAGFEAK